jgi:hypothetical protein
VHHGGVPLGPGASRATMPSTRRSKREIPPSKLLVRNTSRQICWSGDGASEMVSWGFVSWSLSMTESMRASFMVPLGLSSPNRDSKELLLASDARRRLS